MGGFGDLIRGLVSGNLDDGDALGAVAGALGFGGDDREARPTLPPSATATYDRRLAGGRRELNVNDR